MGIDSHLNTGEGQALNDSFVEDFFDREAAEGRYRRGLPPLNRILITCAVLAGLVWAWMDMLDELKYHFSSNEAVMMDGSVPLTDNTFVKYEGILGNKAATVSGRRPGSLRWGPIQFRQVLGQATLIEFDQEQHLDEYQAFTRVKIEGRLRKLSESAEFTPIFHYFSKRFKWTGDDVQYVVIKDERPGQMWRYLIAMLVTFILAGFSIYGFWLRTWIFEPHTDNNKK